MEKIVMGEGLGRRRRRRRHKAAGLGRARARKGRKICIRTAKGHKVCGVRWRKRRR